MTKVFIIAIIMWWADITQTPLNDSVEVKWLHGEPLYFLTEEECFAHIDENLEALTEFGKATYPTAHTVKTILCVEQERHIGDKA
tara:strand:+ start:3735 stop:3989 length:255 start_codon:yes stop_codon:yes gene_type:complete